MKMDKTEKLYLRFDVTIFKAIANKWFNRCDKKRLAEILKDAAAVLETDGTPDFEVNYKFYVQEAMVKELMLKNDMTRDEVLVYMKSIS